jgi:hypothetical protein
MRNVAVGRTKTTVSATVCFATLQEVAGKHIVNAIDLKERKKGYSDRDYLEIHGEGT